MEAPENTSPRDLRPNADYIATLWGPAHLVLATGLLRLTDETRPDCDGIFEPLDELSPVSPERPGVAVSTANFQTAAIQPVDGSVRDSHGRMLFRWADT